MRGFLGQRNGDKGMREGLRNRGTHSSVVTLDDGHLKTAVVEVDPLNGIEKRGDS
jgi:hypothetical protein